MAFMYSAFDFSSASRLCLCPPSSWSSLQGGTLAIKAPLVWVAAFSDSSAIHCRTLTLWEVWGSEPVWNQNSCQPFEQNRRRLSRRVGVLGLLQAQEECGLLSDHSFIWLVKSWITEMGWETTSQTCLYLSFLQKCYLLWAFGSSGGCTLENQVQVKQVFSRSHISAFSPGTASLEDIIKSHNPTATRRTSPLTGRNCEQSNINPPPPPPPPYCFFHNFKNYNSLHDNSGLIKVLIKPDNCGYNWIPSRTERLIVWVCQT